MNDDAAGGASGPLEMSDEARRDFARDALPWTASVRRFALSLCRDDADADDLVQDTYLRAWRSWHTFQAGTDCRRWLFTICRNVFRRRLRDAHRGGHGTDVALSVPLEPPVEAELPHVSSATVDDLVTRMDVDRALGAALRLVPEPYRSTVVAVHVEDRTYEAAAELFDVPVGTIRSRLFRGRSMMQPHLLAVARDAGVVPDDSPAVGKKVGAAGRRVA